MKTTQFRTIRNFLAVCAISATLVACDKDDFNENNKPGVYSTTAQANGSQTTPPTTTSGTATLIGEYNSNTNNWEYRINWASLSSVATAVQIHGPAAVGVSGEMQFSLAITIPGADGRAEGSLTLTEAQEAYLLADQLYFTVLTAANVNGEVRGQIIANEVN